MIEYRPEDEILYREYKKYERMWKDRSAEIVEDMILRGVDKLYSEDGLHYIKLVHMPDANIPNYTRKGYSYIKFNWK